jgi:hypothetical protein
MPEDIPEFPEDMDIGGNEMEGILIMASRQYELQSDEVDSKPVGHFIAEAMKNYRPMSHSSRLEYMDLAAVVECTDRRFLPEKYAELDLEQAKQRMDELKLELGD